MNDGHDTGRRVQEDMQAFTMTVDEAAAATGKSPDTVRRLIRSGALPSIRVQGSRTIEYRVRPEDVQDVQVAMPTYASTHVGMHASAARVPPGAEGERPTSATPARVDVAAGLQAIVAPLVAELAEARQAIERLATEKGAIAGELAEVRRRAQEAEQEGETLQMRVRALEATVAALKPVVPSSGPKMHESLSPDQSVEDRDEALPSMHQPGEPDLWAQLAAKAVAIPEAVTQAFEVLEAAQPEESLRRGLLARLFRRRRDSD